MKIRDTQRIQTGGAAQREQAEAFRALHRLDRPLQLVNVWDAPSARVAVAAGATAVGTSSFAVALDHGVLDGERLDVDAAMAAVSAITEAVDVPTSVDLEAGRGPAPAAVGRTVTEVIRCGAVGLNLEDAVPRRKGTLFDVAEQGERLASARAAAVAADVPVFLNARCDVYFGANLDPAVRLDEVRRRADCYAAAGCDGLFLPGLSDLDVIASIAQSTDLAVNVMVDPSVASLDELAAAGVRRVSQGGVSFLAVTGALLSLTRQYLAGELVPPLDLCSAGLSVVPDLVR